MVGILVGGMPVTSGTPAPTARPMRSWTPPLAPGQVLEPQNHPFSELPDGILITRIAAKGSRTDHFRLNIWGMAYRETICFRPEPPARPELSGTIPARVESPIKGDPDRPYIAAALHDSEHPDHVTERNHTRNVLRTPSNNTLRMEDRRGEEHIRLATEYGKTQLNSYEFNVGLAKKAAPTHNNIIWNILNLLLLVYFLLLNLFFSSG